MFPLRAYPDVYMSTLAISMKSAGFQLLEIAISEIQEPLKDKSI